MNKNLYTHEEYLKTKPRELGCAEAEIEALRAQVEQLREAAKYAFDNWLNSKDVFGAMQLLSGIANKTPAQCLAEIKAQAGRDGYAVGWQACMDYQSKGVCLWEAEYTNQLRQQAKVE